MYVKNNSFCELDHFMIWLYLILENKDGILVM